MRLLATLLVLLVAIYLHLGGVQTDAQDDNDIFNYNNGNMPNIEAYVKLLEELRRRLESGDYPHGIAVTRDPRTIPIQERFIQVQLQNGDEKVITVIINTENVYVVGYLVGGTLHYFKDAPEALLRQAFPNYTYRRLPFGGNYADLPDRGDNPLGHGALNDAIRNLYYGQSQAQALLVIIQMVAEAVRIRYIEHCVRVSMFQNTNFCPEGRIISLENSWSDLSRQVQRACEPYGVFQREIQLQDNDYKQSIMIKNVMGMVRLAALAIMLYDNARKNPTAIRMPVPVAVGADEQCPYGEPTTNIVGRDGLCMTVKNDQYNNGNPIILWACGNAQRNQLWTFKSDGTIRSNGRCLTSYSYPSPGSYIMIFKCDEPDSPEATKWILKSDGTMVNPSSGLVIAAETSSQGTVLTLAVDNGSSRQAWSAGNYTEPPKSYISGLREMCLQANGAGARVWLANCVIGTEPRQQWALYADSTIRLYSDRTLCVTSVGSESLDSIILYKCNGLAVQRWTFRADGTILNPNAQLVMDVRNSDVSLQDIILFRFTGNDNQKWLAF